MLEPLRPKKRKAKFWLAISLGLLCAQIVAFSLSQFALYDVYASNSADVSDNQTWVVSQLEVDYQNLKNSLLKSDLDAASRPDETVSEDSWSDVIMAFDIYYSRVDTAKSQLAGFQDNGELSAEYSKDLEDILKNRDELTRMLDTDGSPERAFIQRFLTVMERAAEPVRDLALDTLYLLSQQADSERNAAQNYFLFHITLAFLTVALLITVTVTILLMLQMSRRQNLHLESVLASQERLFQNIPHSVVIANSDGNILRSNHAFEELFGWAESEVKGRKLWEILPEKRRAVWARGTMAATQTFLREGRVRTLRDIAIDKNGRWFPIEITIMQLQQAGSTVYMVMLRSIVVEQRAMRALRRDRTEARKWAYRNSRLLSVMGHEMRTPLHGVISALDLAKRKTSTDTKSARELVEVALDASQTALEHADHALELVALEFDPANATPSDFSPADIVHKVIEMLRPAANLKGNVIKTEIADGVESYVFGYAELVRHSLSNLLGNAIKFTNEGEIVVRLFPYETNAEFRIEVADTGVGISEKQKEDIFCEYVSHSPQHDTNWQSTGLGLSLFKRAVSGMRGDWGFSSQLHQGSTFWFTFPSKESEIGSNLTVDTDDEPGGFLQWAPRILAVDDNPINLALLDKMLDELGLQHDLAKNGYEAFQKANETHFEVVIMDISMPGQDGFETSKKIRNDSVSQDATIIAFTADTSINRSDEVFSATGLNDVLFKPVTLEALRSKLGQLAVKQKVEADCTQSKSDRTTDRIVDRKVIADLTSISGLEELLPFIQKLLSQAAATKDTIERGAKANEPKLSEQLHDLSGAAAMLGAVGLAEASRDCETAISRNTAIQSELFCSFCTTVDATKEQFSALFPELCA